MIKLAALFALIPSVVFALAEDGAANSVLQFERDCCKAFQQGDTQTLEKMLTDDFTLTLSDGTVSTRADELGELRTGKVHYEIFENAKMKVRLYGESVAVDLGQTRVKGTSDTTPFDRTVQFTDTVVKQNGSWKLAAGHVSPLKK